MTRTYRSNRELPPGTEKDILDIIAKALMLRAGGSVVLTENEREQAAAVQAEFEIDRYGALTFRIERQ
jgi:hypothetical protein